MLVDTDPEHETLPPPPPVSETGTESLIAEKISENIKDVNEKAKEALEQVGDEIIKDTVTDVKDDMEEKLEQIKDKAEEKIDDLKEEIEIKVYDELNISGVNFICIDTQGYELEALKGCKNSLKKIDYIYTEVNRDYLYEENPLISDLDLFLKNFGFIRVETKWAKDGLLPWGDAFYVKLKNLTKRDITTFKIKNFMCPIWQIESEKIIHDNESLILYQKHSKLRFFKTQILIILNIRAFAN